MSAQPPEPSGLDPDDPIGIRYPNTARIWNYQLGGKDNFAIDRNASDAANTMVRGLGVPAGADTAVESRHLLQRMVDYMLGQGVRQFLDLGSGLPNMANTHQIAHRAAPGARVVYSDLGFITLGFILQRVAGASLADLARREIFEPLGLTRTFFNPSKSLQTEVAACESGGNAYERGVCETEGRKVFGEWRTQTIWGEVHDGNAFFLGGAAGHAGLFSTARETLRIAEQFLTRTTRLLSPDTCALFPLNMTEGLNEARSFAWQLAATPESTAGPRLPPEAFGHLGFTGTSCWTDPARERTFILLTNRTHARALPFVNINSVRRRFHTLAVEALERDR